MSCCNIQKLISSYLITGDDGSADEPQQGILVKESESLYTLWCTGRVGCNGLLVELKVMLYPTIKAFCHSHNNPSMGLQCRDTNLDNFYMVKSDRSKYPIRREQNQSSCLSDI